jgi:beta-lactamase superfamily II metal-dependent hydrolase
MGIHTIHNFFVTNYDEDHINDLVALRNRLNIQALYRNRSISTDQLRSLKLSGGPISPSMEAFLEMNETYIHDLPAPPPEFPRVTFTNFYNTYSTEFADTNNLSLVCFVTCGDTKFIIPGDIERKGWLGLLAQPGFISELGDVSVFVASHHGRESGYCAEVFHYCTPDVIVFSDSNIKHATQEMSNTYSSHASGMYFNNKLRSVVTTRNDGDIFWDR